MSAELALESERIADEFASVRPDEQSRPGRRSNGSVFTVDTLAKYFLHDVEHHAHDVSPRYHPIRTMAECMPRSTSSRSSRSSDS